MQPEFSYYIQLRNYSNLDACSNCGWPPSQPYTEEDRESNEENEEDDCFLIK